MYKKITSISFLLLCLLSCTNTAPTSDKATPSPSQSASSKPVNELTNLTTQTCDQEGKLVSKIDNRAVNLTFNNKSGSTLKFYWLNYAGTRIPYKTLNNGDSYLQGTFVTHPWLVADEKDQCIGIYTSTEPGNASLTITDTGK